MAIRRYCGNATCVANNGIYKIKGNNGWSWERSGLRWLGNIPNLDFSYVF